MNKKFKLGEDIIYEDTGKIVIHGLDNPYITRVYRVFTKGEFGYETVEGEPIYFEELTSVQRILVQTMADSQEYLSNTLKREPQLKPLK
jgi:hypothetical protein